MSSSLNPRFVTPFLGARIINGNPALSSAIGICLDYLVRLGTIRGTGAEDKIGYIEILIAC
jgi:hypothetical protein